MTTNEEYAAYLASVDTSAEACAVACMLVSNPQGALRQDGAGWQRRVNDLIRALRRERDDLVKALEEARAALAMGDDGAALPPGHSDLIARIDAALSRSKAKGG